jgi:carbamoyl-phosphate synthase large subunit
MTTPEQRRPPRAEGPADATPSGERPRDEKPSRDKPSGGQPGPVTRVLVTGAGGPAAIAAMKSLRADASVELLAADMDPWASGLYLVPPQARTLIPAGGAADFTEVALARCRALGVDVLLPTVDAELRPLAAARARFAAHGIDLLLAPAGALDVILDKLVLARHCAAVVRVPRTEALDDGTDPSSWSYPVVVKPRSGSGSRGFLIVSSGAELTALAGEPGLLVQEFLPGEEYSIDVLADAGGRVIAVVPRLRARVDSGVSVGGRTVHDGELESFGRAVAEATGVTFVANVQCKRDAGGRPALLEVNPRMPGTLGLTIASGVDMPRLALDSLRGQPVPAALGFREVAVVRFLDERVIDPAEIDRVGVALTGTRG